jgi:hypothetical protein
MTPIMGSSNELPSEIMPRVLRANITKNIEAPCESGFGDCDILSHLSKVDVVPAAVIGYLPALYGDLNCALVMDEPRCLLFPSSPTF